METNQCAGTLTDEERAEHARLKSLKAWGPRFRELDRRAAEEATRRWRRDDVFGPDRKPFADEIGAPR